MADEQAFLDAIIAAPADDAVRLVFADWLDERGGESDAARAEYTRLEVEAAQADPAAPETPARKAAKRRAAALLRAHAAQWFPAFAGRRNRLRGGQGAVSYRRGFPRHVAAAASRLLAVGPELARLAPLEWCEFQGLATEQLRQLAAAPWVAGLQGATLAGPDATDWGALADGPHALGLGGLVLSGGGLTEAAAARLAAGAGPRVRDLNFLNTPLADGAVRGLFAGPGFGGLEKLTLYNAALTRAGAEAVAAAPALAGLRSLALYRNSVPGAAGAVGRSPFWPGLRALDLSVCELGDAGVADLAAAGPGALAELTLEVNGVGAAGARAIAGAPWFGTLRKLGLSHNPVRSEGAAALAGSPGAASLRTLRLSGCGLGPAGAKALADSPHLAGLRTLWVWWEDVGVEGAKALTRSPHLRGLTELWGGPAPAAVRKLLKARFGGS